MNTTQELEDFLNLTFPKYTKYDTTYLDIIASQTKENTISRIYAHYLDFRKSHVISNWFITSLLDIIKTKSGKEFSLNDYDVFTEFSTIDNKGRIDLVIESKKSETVIIIENKIFHWLHNDLNNYWGTFNYYSNEKKIGILLALTNLQSNNSNFISFSHIEWISKIESFVDKNLLNKREKIHLEDFITNIKYITNQRIMNDNIKFYLDHNKKIEEVIQFKEDTTIYILACINSIALKYNWELYGNTPNYRQIWDKKNDIRVFYTLLPNEIITKKQLKIIIEIDGKAREYHDSLMTLLKKEDIFNDFFLMGNFKNVSSSHIGFRCFFNLTDKDFEMFEFFLNEKIEELEPLRKLILLKLVELGYNIPEDYIIS